MSILTGLQGPPAIALICLLLFVEEAGVPVPVLSGDVLLILAGALIVSGGISPWAFFPAAFGAEVAGVMTAHLWSRAVGQRGLEVVADKLRLRKALDRASARLSAAGPLHIAIARLVPGLRITTTLVAGAGGVPAGTFLLGVVPAIVIWMAAYTLLGVVVGLPVVAAVDHVEHLAVIGAALLFMALAIVAGIRYIPSVRRIERPWIRAAVPTLLALSILLDIAIATIMASTVTELLHRWLGFKGVISVALLVALVTLAYVAATRRTIGGTPGERLTGVRYEATPGGDRLDS